MNKSKFIKFILPFAILAGVASCNKTEELSGEAEILSFSFDETIEANSIVVSEPVIEGNSIKFNVAADATAEQLTALVPEIKVSEKATVSPASGQAVDFSNGPVTFTVTAQNGINEKEYYAEAIAESAEDPENPDDMKKKPIKSGSLFEKSLIVRVVFYGILIGMISLAAYLIGSKDSYEVGMTMAFLVLCMSQIVHALNQHSATLSVFSKKHPRNKYLYLAMFISFAILMLVVFIPPLASFFSLASLSLSEWVIVSLLSISPLVFLEIFKLIRNI